MDAVRSTHLWFLVLLVFAANLVSATLFIGRIHKPVGDDNVNMVDVRLYVAHGVSAASIRSQTNPPGPLGFVWMAEGVRLLGGDDLRDARLAALFSWVLTVSAVLLLSRYTGFQNVWLGALLVLLAFPHTVESMTLVLTEGPALFFATVGVLLWVESATRETTTTASQLFMIGGGLSMGLAVVCRQYYLALLPAAGLFALFHSTKRGRSWWASVVASLITAVLPAILLVAIWKGVTSPGMATGTSYENWRAAAGLNFFRPVVAAFYAAFYLLLLTFPVMSALKPALRWRPLALALAIGLVFGSRSDRILQPGPLRTALHFAARHSSIALFALFGLIAAATAYNTIALGSFLWERRSIFRASPLLTFGLLFVAFFIAEQVGVGGNLFLYERYTLQLAPFLGVVAFSAFPRLTYPRLLVLAAMLMVSHVMLWRSALGG
ncbi:MAG TPA: phospholipid carrier-dependent glycosyltransferase [Candidatus Aquilonibacter sp.]|nr:phospholipid carrier-dependent glycosyltransferase [Candidatus Aquilonibacter sp.]